MCLHELTKKYKRPKIYTRNQGGYKIFEVLDTETVVTPYYGSTHIIGQLYTDEKTYTIFYKIEYYNNRIKKIYYETGYHIYKNKKDAMLIKRSDPIMRNRKTRIFRVLYNNIVVEGTQDDFKVVVAKKMKVIV